jgi:hypothetical protein
MQAALLACWPDSLHLPEPGCIPAHCINEYLTWNGVDVATAMAFVVAR